MENKYVKKKEEANCFKNSAYLLRAQKKWLLSIRKGHKTKWNYLSDSKKLNLL